MAFSGLRPVQVHVRTPLEGLGCTTLLAYPWHWINVRLLDSPILGHVDPLGPR